MSPPSARGLHAAEKVDRQVLSWIGRFRFVTAALVGERFGVSVQMARVRRRRFEQEGLLARERATHTEKHAVFLTPAGAAAGSAAAPGPAGACASRA